MLRCRPWELGAGVDWAAARAATAGFATAACEPTGHRWQVLGQLATEGGMPFVCVQTLLVAWARRNEDLTNDKTDDRDAMLIGRLVGELRCYVPEPVNQTWNRLRHLGAHRERLVEEAVGQVQQMRDLLECAWPAVLDAAAQPLKSATWCTALDVVLSRAGGDLARVRRLGLARFEAAVRKQLPRWGAARPCLRIVRAVFAALSDSTGVRAVRPGILQRVHLVQDYWRHTAARLGETEEAMVAVLDELGLRDLACSITGLSAVGAAAILAETGDPTRFATPRALVKHAGLAPRERASGAYTGKTRIGRARSSRVAAGGLARRLGDHPEQPRLRRPAHPPDHPRAQPAVRRAGPRGDCRRDPAAPACRGHPQAGMGPDIAAGAQTAGATTKTTPRAA